MEPSAMVSCFLFILISLYIYIFVNIQLFNYSFIWYIESNATPRVWYWCWMFESLTLMSNCRSILRGWEIGIVVSDFSHSLILASLLQKNSPLRWPIDQVLEALAMIRSGLKVLIGWFWYLPCLLYQSNFANNLIN